MDKKAINELLLSKGWEEPTEAVVKRGPDQRKNVKVNESVKTHLEDLKEMNDFKNESEVIAYLLAFYGHFYSDLTVKTNFEIKKLSRNMDNQMRLF
jgi:hypothetical protein